MQRHEVVLEVEVGEVVAVEELIWQLLQAAAGQVHRVHPLRGDLRSGGEWDTTVTSWDKDLEGRSNWN